MSYSELEHFSNMLAGCESLTEGDTKEPNAIYALAVLKLHANDGGYISGTEGFLDAVKKGVSNTVKWVRELMTSILNWVKNTFLKLIGNRTRIVVSKEVSEEFLIPGLEKALNKLKEIKALEVDSIMVDLERYITAAKKGGNLSSYNEAVVGGIRTLFDKTSGIVFSLREGSPEDNHKAGEIGADLRRVGDVGNDILLCTKKALSGGGWVLPDSLIRAVGIGVRRARPDILLSVNITDYTPSDIRNIIKYAEDRMPDLYESHDENAGPLKLGTDKDPWTPEDYYSASAITSSNFSKERINNLLAISKYLRDKGIKGF